MRTPGRREEQRVRRRERRKAVKLARFVESFRPGVRAAIAPLARKLDDAPEREALAHGTGSYDGTPFALLLIRGDVSVTLAFERMVTLLEGPEKGARAGEEVTRTLAGRDGTGDEPSFQAVLDGLVAEVVENMAKYIQGGALIHTSFGIHGTAAALFLALGAATASVVTKVHEDLEKKPAEPTNPKGTPTTP